MQTATEQIYEQLDPFKVAAMEAAATTASFMERLGWKEYAWSRGESCYLFRHVKSGIIRGLTIEGLGTKNRVAEDPALRARFGDTFYGQVAICNAAMIKNDMITVGALPLVTALHPAIGGGGVLSGTDGKDLIAGTVKAAHLGRCTWGPGETPSLKGIVVPGTMCLSGAGIGFVRDEAHLMNWHNVRTDLRIVLLESSGIHANGLTDARGIVEQLPDEYLTDIGDGRTYGEALLTPTLIYSPVIERCQDEGVPLVYGVNITGHGWRKLMRAEQSLTYIIDNPPAIPELFDFIMRWTNFGLIKMYETFNMGAGFALFVVPEAVDRVLAIAESEGFAATNAGMICEGKRQVIIKMQSDELVLGPLKLR